MKSQLYAHRSVSSLMVQELIFDNPTVSNATGVLQIEPHHEKLCLREFATG